MYVAFLAGGIASGKSTVGRILQSRGALLVDLDAVSRDVTQAGSEVCARIASAFGQDVLDVKTGELRRAVLAERAFASAQTTAKLESIVHPAIRVELQRQLEETEGFEVAVVEVPLLNRVEDLAKLADEVVCVVCPLEVRCARAVQRGMTEQDFARCVAQQPSDEYLLAHATTVINNDGDERALRAQVDAWWNDRAERGWS